MLLPFPSLTHKTHFTIFTLLFPQPLVRDKAPRALEDDGATRYKDSESLNHQKKGYAANIVTRAMSRNNYFMSRNNLVY